MAAEWGPAERWRAALPQHAAFSRLRESGAATSAAPRSPLIRSLLLGLDGDLLLWDGERGALLDIDLRRLSGAEPELGRYQVSGAGLRGAPRDGRRSEPRPPPRLSRQTLLCINPPLFEVYQTLLSPARHHVALIGTKGLSAVELPKRWGKNSEFEGGKAVVNCRWEPSSALPPPPRPFGSRSVRAVTAVVSALFQHHPGRRTVLHQFHVPHPEARGLVPLRDPGAPHRAADFG